ncbi:MULTISPECIES: ParB/RepB/Spo0J family partition protein [Streptomyces]|uniref:ParB/RepB/Spo0J family partition protein n=1 Tax=Streptomyces glycanivorans TaxID=3033808 RepID=A0ABY9JCE7_9ACTN|nr:MULTISPECIES: ParB/RepB/Spo0J family partition protein [unclassified Streptomyces]WSQ78767.1 ParB/RepB/Spo0J family partition protein [Streptomyces sp. NBC_01213]TXS17033.1 ParB/RepB/Spo0J family partition protein [Streptomyces sp. wa22]WLQ65385.1 ParB/RepB/Spo0J family partition protein [Streptomyces sp. Alt3]WSQ86136.1 ParB/RepB/Spo0J family partition protein [Streptomyces sp. NBC_01212]WSR07782.1 ParB/RepB/Spo0J family partition protein [Streptomyces sp. NBC_01208]
MSERRRGLGRGLGALIPAAPQEKQVASPASGTAAGAAGPTMTAERGVAVAKLTALPSGPLVPEPSSPVGERGPAAEQNEVAGAYFAEVPLTSISPNPKQPREVFDEDALAELVTSIKEVGLLQPVIVRQVDDDRYELIMGERRWRACGEAGLERIPAIVRATDDEKLLLDALLENLHRAQLNPLEEAAAYDQLLKDFKCTHDQLADRIGRSRPQVSNTLRLLRLSPPVQRRVAAGVLSAGHARALLSVDDSDEQDRLAHRIVAEGLSVRAVEEIVNLLGSEPTSSAKPRGPRAGGRVSPALTDLASRLSDRFETRVKVDLGQKKGKIVVEFASMEDLDRILGSLAPGEGRVLERSTEEEQAEADET